MAFQLKDNYLIDFPCFSLFGHFLSKQINWISVFNNVIVYHLVCCCVYFRIIRNEHEEEEDQTVMLNANKLTHPTNNRIMAAKYVENMMHVCAPPPSHVLWRSTTEFMRHENNLVLVACPLYFYGLRLFVHYRSMFRLLWCSFVSERFVVYNSITFNNGWVTESLWECYILNGLRTCRGA